MTESLTVYQANLAQGLATIADVVDPVAQSFVDAGHRLFLVGGVVRDLMLGDTSYDLDLTTDAHPETIKALVAPHADALWSQGERFGTIGLRVGEWDLEITTHRADAYDDDSRNPVVRFGDSLQEDLSRRDFTINAMAVEVPLHDDTLTLIDPYDGVGDLAAASLRTPLSADISFVDDPLRVLRAARFAARFDLKPVAELTEAAITNAARLEIVAAERIAGELERLWALPDPSAGVAFLDLTGVLDQAVPAIASLPGDERAEALRLATAPGDAVTRRCGLLWPLGPDRADTVLRQLRYSNQDRALTVNLLRALTEADCGRPSEGAVRRAVAVAGFDQLSVLRRLAINLKADPLVEVLDQLSTSEDLSDLASPLTGAEIIEHGQIRPGPVVGRAQRYLRDHRLDHGPVSRDEAIVLLTDWLRGDS